MNKSFLIKFLMVVSFSLLFIVNGFGADDFGEEIRLYMGEPRIIAVNNPTRVVIGNPSIADVTNVSKTEIALNPKSTGTTTLTIWDSYGEQPYLIKVFSANMQEIKQRIDSILEKLDLPGIYTKTADAEGKVLILGKVKTAQERERINTALATLKDQAIDLILVKEEEAVIDIDVQLMELSRDATTTLGFTWPTTRTLTFTEKGSAGIADAGTKWSTLFKILNFNRTVFSWTLDALVKEGKARILSRPRLACQSGKEAELMVGGEKPIFATYTTETTTGATVEYKEYGIKLKIKPTVTEEKRIKLALNVEVSEVEAAETIGSTSTGSTWAKAYPLKKRTASTELYLDDGQTLAIGGLIKQKSEEDVEKVPWLGEVPIIGALFRKKTSKTGGGTGERGNTELFITLTPTIVSEREEEAAGQKEKTAESKAPSAEGPSVSGEITSAMLLKKEKRAVVLTPSGEQVFSDALQHYISLVKKRILDNLGYPFVAKESGFQGVVTLNLNISYSGELLAVSVKSSSGYKVLDENAVMVSREVAPYPPFPPSIEQKELKIEIPIVYRLD